jgi:uncharacterized protein (DUF58 family)
MKPERWLLLTLIFSLALAGLATQRGELVALTLPLLVYLGVALWHAPIRSAGKDSQAVSPASDDAAQVSVNSPITGERVLSCAHARLGQPVEMQISLFNQGPEIEEVRLVAPLPPGVQLATGRQQTHITLETGERALLEATLQSRRGEFYFGALTGEISETFGLFSTRFEVMLPARLSVEPEGETLRSFVLRPPQTRGFAGPVPARQGGRGTNFFTVREYQPGDSLRHVNWRASSRAAQTLYTNVFEQQRIADVGIILDAREQADIRGPLDSLFEYSVRAAVSLTGPILQAGNRLGMLVYGPGMESIFPGYGKIQQRRILKALARAGSGHNYALESLEHLPTRFFPTGSQIILISPLLPGDPPLVARLSTLGYGVIVISPDPLAFEVAPDASSAKDPALRLAQIERRIQFQRLQRAGVVVVDWDVRQPLAALFYAAVRRSARGRR